ncbi:MAG: UbiA family prenyltransferase [Kofleriaceae bacterium]|nr:UbiA family prenyltransferase [Kofleriaceae bacterium]MBP9167854.1 UbiA family prenyltransferase [Kofleriaceae bacterium]MBP9859361.1 UbiA family prenyltransferase [Kofleriaceae bacterium]
MTSSLPREHPVAAALADAAAISRAHILAIGAVAAVVFGWILGGRYLWAVGAIAGLDWFLINLMNRVTDLAEDAKNGIRGTARVARHARAITVGAWALLVGSIALGHLVWPALTPWRIAVQGIGLGYNYPIVPTLRGLTRFKEMYFWKNFGSALLFVLTGFVYPLAILHADGTPRLVSDAAIVALILFFIPFELTYEILYDLRDLEGDRAEGVPTYPVVHGPTVARRIIDGLLLGASAVLMAAVALGELGLRELLMLVAPAVQFVLYRRWWARGLTPRDCIVLTHVGTAQLVLFLVGTALWQRAGLPVNVYL